MARRSNKAPLLPPCAVPLALVLALAVGGCAGSTPAAGDGSKPVSDGRVAGDGGVGGDGGRGDAAAGDGVASGDAAGDGPAGDGPAATDGPAPPRPRLRAFWRSVQVQSIPTAGTCDATCVDGLNRDDGVYLRWLACSNGNNTQTEYDNPTDLRFAVPEHAVVSDATLRLDAFGNGGTARAELTCVDAAGKRLATISPARLFAAKAATVVFDVPLACFAGPTVTVRVRRTNGSCIAVDHVRLDVGSDRRSIPVAAVLARGSCNATCVAALNRDDGDYLRWLACSNGNNTQTEYDTPTDLRFVVPEHFAVRSATFDLDLYPSGADARVRITCVDGAGAQLAAIFQSAAPFAAERRVYSWAVPRACFAAPEVTVRVERTGSHCLAVDSARLAVASRARGVPVAAVAARGSCDATCRDAINLDDGDYLRWLACSNGNNTQTEYDTPTDLRFSVYDHASVSGATFALDAFGSGPAATARVSCVDAQGGTLAVIFAGAQAFAAEPRTYVWAVPAACFASETVTIRVERTGGNCLGVDYARLYTASSLDPAITLNGHGIEGYVAPLSVAPGDTLALKVHSPAPTFSVVVTRHGAPDKVVATLSGVAGGRQHYPWDAYRRGCGWKTSRALVVGSTWTSGLYTARLSDGGGGTPFDVTFVVRDSKGGAAGRLAVLASTHTWNAYNAWGGASSYTYKVADSSGRAHAHLLSVARPNPAAHARGDVGHLSNGELHLLRWLDKNRYGYAMLAAEDLHGRAGVLAGYSALIINTHSEYWSKAMYDALEAYLAGGGNLLYLSGNGVYWKVTRAGDAMETRKNKTLHAHDGTLGGLWRDLGRPEAAVLGVQYDARAYATSAPYRVLVSSHWAFANTGLSDGALVGATGKNLAGGGASGWEMDRVVSGVTPANAVVIARGTNSPVGADMLYYQHKGGGGVFSAGSINFAGALEADGRLGQVLHNVLGRFGVKPRP